ncbi:MAG: hypothetical protein ACREJM_11605, partial [Candidatus Saccharimonadales bacterium]
MRQLYELRDDLADALEVPTLQAQSAPANYTLNSFLIRGQAFLYRKYRYDQLYRYWQIFTAGGQNLYATPGASTR